MAGGRRISGTLEEVLASTILKQKDISVDEIAERIGKQSWYLYAVANPKDKKQLPLPLLIPLMRATDDTSLVEHIALSMGLVVTRIRKRGKGGLEHVEDIQECIESFSELLLNLTKAFRDGSRVDKRAVIAAIDRFLSVLAGFRQDVENLSEQYELELED